jgi:hypothetical protein
MPSATLDVASSGALGPGARAGVLHRGQCGGDREELVLAELAHGLDVERRSQVLGVGVGHAGQRRGRRVENLLERLVLVGLVERLRRDYGV